VRYLRREHGHPRLAGDEVLPLVHIRMPVQFAHTTRLYLDQGGRNRLGDLEQGGIGDADGSALHADRLLSHHVVAVGQGNWSGAGDAVRRQWPGDWRLENPEVFLRDAIESALAHAEVFG